MIEQPPRVNTEQDAIDQILHTARQERVDWVIQFLKEREIATAADIATAVDAALRSYKRMLSEFALSETVRTPRHVALSGGDHEDCAAFAIALAIGLALPYQLSANKGTLHLVIDDVAILPETQR